MSVNNLSCHFLKSRYVLAERNGIYDAIMHVVTTKLIS